MCRIILFCSKEVVISFHGTWPSFMKKENYIFQIKAITRSIELDREFKGRSNDNHGLLAGATNSLRSPPRIRESIRFLSCLHSIVTCP